MIETTPYISTLTIEMLTDDISWFTNRIKERISQDMNRDVTVGLVQELERYVTELRVRA